MKRILSVLFLALFIWSCQDNRQDSGSSLGPSGSQVFGGTEVLATSEMAKKIVAIFYEDPMEGPSVCTGTFIKDNLILTAGHCVTEQLEQMTVTFGVDPLNPEHSLLTLPVVQVYRHPNYNPAAQQRNDLALIEFSGGLPLGAEIARLADDDSLDLKSAILAAGFGIGERDSLNPTRAILLHFVELTILPQFTTPTDFQVDQTQRKGVCRGDSGGPAFQQSSKGLILIGVASAVLGYEEETDDPISTCRARALYSSLSPGSPLLEFVKSQKAAHPHLAEQNVPSLDSRD